MSARRLTGGAALALLRHLVSALAGLWTVALVGRWLGASRLGAWSLLGTMSFLLGLGELGSSGLVQRLAARPDARREELHEALGMALAAVSFTALPLALVGAALVLSAAQGDLVLRAELWRALVPALTAGALGAACFPLRALLVGRGALSPLARARSVAAVLQVLLSTAAVLLGGGLAGVAAGLLLGNAVEFAGLYRGCAELVPVEALRPRFRVRPGRWRSALREGAAPLTMNLAIALAVRVDTVLLSRVATLAEVAAYALAARVVDQWATVVRQFGTAALSRLGARETREETLRRGTVLLGALVGSGLVALALCGQPVLALWAGAAARHPTLGLALGLLGLAASVSAVHELALTAVSLGEGSLWRGSLPEIGGCVVNIVLSFSLVGRYGASAVAGATVVGNLVTLGWTWASAARLLQWSARQVLVLVGVALVPVLVAAGPATVARALGPASLLLSVLGGLAAVSTGAFTTALVVRRL